MKKENTNKAFVSFVVVVVFSLQFFATFRLCNYLPRSVSFFALSKFHQLLRSQNVALFDISYVQIRALRG